MWFCAGQTFSDARNLWLSSSDAEGVSVCGIRTCGSRKAHTDSWQQIGSYSWLRFKGYEILIAYRSKEEFPFHFGFPTKGTGQSSLVSLHFDMAEPNLYV
jgi:hypothetical protein